MMTMVRMAASQQKSLSVKNRLVHPYPDFGNPAAFLRGRSAGVHLRRLSRTAKACGFAAA